MVEITDDNYTVSVNLTEDGCAIWITLEKSIMGFAYMDRIMGSGLIQQLLGQHHPKEENDDLVKRTTDAAMQNLQKEVDHINERIRLTNLASAHLKPNITIIPSETNDRLQWHET